MQVFARSIGVFRAAQTGTPIATPPSATMRRFNAAALAAGRVTTTLAPASGCGGPCGRAASRMISRS